MTTVRLYLQPENSKKDMRLLALNLIAQTYSTFNSAVNKYFT